MKKLLTISLGISAICLVLIFSAFKNEKAQTALIATTNPTWKMAKMHTLEVLDAMPEEKFSYKPTEESKTFASQMVHIGYTLKYFRMGMIEGNRIKYEEPDASTMNKAEIRKMVEEEFDNYINAIQGLTDEDLSAELPFGKETKITRAQSILFAHDHVTNHRAKANLYIRMNDIDPPNYKFI